MKHRAVSLRQLRFLQFPVNQTMTHHLTSRAPSQWSGTETPSKVGCNRAYV